MTTDTSAAAPYVVIDPSTGEPFTEVPMATVAQTDKAIERAHRALADWKRVTPGDRAALLRRFAQLVDDNSEELARLEIRNSGHTIGNATWEVTNVRDVLNYYSAAPERLIGKQIPVAGGTDITFYEPIGVVGVIVPWNFPMPIASWGFAPALAAGNTVVLKPAELTPLTALRLAELALEAGIPEHVFTVIPGRGDVVGERFVTHPLVRKVCFTGSTAVGKRIMAGCADQVKRVTLELGGKSANILFADSDIAAAAAAAPMAAFDNAGQDCCSRSRVLVERPAYDDFMSALADSIASLRVLEPDNPESQIGPLISATQKQRVQGYVDQAQVALQGTAPDGGGFWFPPTVIEVASSEDRTWREEIFGPVLSVLAFDTEEEAIAMANDTEYGLSGSIFTRDIGRAFRVARGVESGSLSVNSHSSVRYWTPFGGFKQSGLGRELGPDAPQSFTEEKNLFIAH